MRPKVVIPTLGVLVLALWAIWPRNRTAPVTNQQPQPQPISVAESTDSGLIVATVSARVSTVPPQFNKNKYESTTTGKAPKNEQN